MGKDITYTFKNISSCNMCGSNTYKILGRRMNSSQVFNPSGKIGLATTIVKCTNCSLIYSNPMPKPSSIEDHYSVDPNRYWKEEYFNLDNDYFSAEIILLQKLTNNAKKLKTLDIGAGFGKQMFALKRAGYEVFGFEPSSTFYDLARDRFSFSSDTLQLTSIEDAEYPKEKFDFISFGAVLEHLYDPNLSITKALSWLKVGGLIHIEVPSSQWLVGRGINLMHRMRGKDYVSNLSPMHPPYHLYEFNRKSFEENGRLNNYEIINHAYYVCDTFLPKVVDIAARKVMSRTNTGMQLCVWLKKCQ